MKSAPFIYHLARDVEEAVTLLAQVAPEGGRILAGGQTMIPAMALRLVRPPHLVDINAIPGLDQVTIEGDELRVGATVRHAALERLPGDMPGASLLAYVAGHIGHLPIRNRGTFCGSLAHAAPTGEWCLVLAALGGSVVTRSLRGGRILPAEEFFQGSMTTTLANDELIVQARITLPAADARWGFQELSRRVFDPAMAMALVTLRLEAGRIAAACVAVGGAERIPRRLPGVEAMLLGNLPGGTLFRSAAGQAAAEIDPITDQEVDADLRRDFVRGMTRRALEQAMDYA
jgi:aerobic carbon-monoxide dehydrogenase medium subunit